MSSNVGKNFHKYSIADLSIKDKLLLFKNIFKKVVVLSRIFCCTETNCSNLIVTFVDTNLNLEFSTLLIKTNGN